MKKTHIIKRLGTIITVCTSLFMFTSPAHAQTEWAPVGATWYFNRPSFSSSGSYVLFESIKDSVINDKDVSVIKVTINGVTPVSHEYIHQHGDSVFYFNSHNNAFYLLYNFSAVAGDTIVVHDSYTKLTPAFFHGEDSIEGFIYRVLEVDSTFISDRWVKRQKVESLTTSWGFTEFNVHAYILNGIGSQLYFFGLTGAIPIKFYPSMLRCYDEPGFSFINPAWNHECDFISAAGNDPKEADCRVYPNPVDDIARVHLSEPIETLTIRSIDGRTLQTYTPLQQDASIVVSTLRKGSYLIIITSKHRNISKIIIKN
ncbi:MAG TPA: hypothetical protein DEO70_02980 [Bacteroidales bacterium]|nr:hypothetical protein [Bacteroidales bacterium]